MKVNPSAAALSDSPSVLRRQVAQAGEVTRKMAAPVEIGPASAQEVQASAVYTPRDDTPDVTYSHLKLSAWVLPGRPITSGAFINENTSAMQGAFSRMKSAWNAFHQTLATAAPDLAKKEFSFSVDENGDMVATNPHGTLTATQMTRLTALMNKSGELKKSTNEFAESTMAYASTSGSGLENIDLNMSNFHTTVDISTLLKHSQPHYITGAKHLMVDWDHNLNQQLHKNGIQRTWIDIA